MSLMKLLVQLRQAAGGGSGPNEQTHVLTGPI